LKLKNKNKTGIGTLLEDSFDTNVDNDFKMALRKLHKKDTLTKYKALEELKGLIETKSQEDCVAILGYWQKSYSKLTLDYDRKIREICQKTHASLCSKVEKNLAPFLKPIMPFWLMAQTDPVSTNARKTAEESFKTLFNESRQPEVVYFARDEIVNVLYDNLIQQVTITKTSEPSRTQDEDHQRYELIISMSMKTLELFLRYLIKNKNAQNIEKLVQIFNESKFWKYSKDTSTLVRRIVSFFFLIL
jgi:E3 ubiquitin-protein ligase listerin